MRFSQMRFRRRFAMNMVKNRRLQLAQMSLDKDFVRDTRGDMYPVLEREGECAEAVRDGRYAVFGGRIARMLGGHFPYASYELRIEELSGACGFAFFAPQGKVEVLFSVREEQVVCRSQVQLHVGAVCKTTVSDLRDGTSCLEPGQMACSGIAFAPGLRAIVTARREYWDCYLDAGAGVKYVCTWAVPEFADMDLQAVFERTQAAVCAQGGAEICTWTAAFRRPICAPSAMKTAKFCRRAARCF